MRQPRAGNPKEQAPASPAQPAAGLARPRLKGEARRLLSPGSPADPPSGRVVGVKNYDRDRQLATPEFRAWFKESKVVDSAGKPLVVYHGSPARFDQFLIGKATKNYMWGHAMEVTRMGAFFATERSQAATFARETGRVLPVYLNLQNPADLFGGFSTDIWRDLGPLLREWNIDIHPARDMWELFDLGTVGGPEFVAALKAHGYDGARIEEDGGEVWVAFEPTQIKLARGNRGAFDPSNPDLRS